LVANAATTLEKLYNPDAATEAALQELVLKYKAAFTAKVNMKVGDTQRVDLGLAMIKFLEVVDVPKEIRPFLRDKIIEEALGDGRGVLIGGLEPREANKYIQETYNALKGRSVTDLLEIRERTMASLSGHEQERAYYQARPWHVEESFAAQKVRFHTAELDRAYLKLGVITSLLPGDKLLQR
jgi:hypothetical protein